MHTYFVTCAKGMEELIAVELQELGLTHVKTSPAVVTCTGDLGAGYRLCLWSRFANRVLLALSTADQSPFIDASADLYKLISDIDWEQHLGAGGRFVVNFSGTNKAINNSQFGAVCVKDAIVDRFTGLYGSRPTVDKQAPDLRVHVHLARDRASVSIDLSGESLHRRGYRSEQGEAPLKETLAAGLLHRAGWPALAAEGGALVDPMCGAGTFLIEGAMMAADMAPGLLRERFGFQSWLGHDATLWSSLLEEAQARQAAGVSKLTCRFWGSDENPRVLRFAHNNASRAGFSGHITWQHQALEALPYASQQASTGLVVCNPPYGERMGEVEGLQQTYRQLGRIVKERCAGWSFALFTSNEDLAREMRLRPEKRYRFYNGPLAGQLLLYKLLPPEQARLREDSADHLSDNAQMVVNRLLKNKKRLAPWLAKANTDCYRLYDADLPEYSAAIDVYGEQVHVQEYAPPKSIDPNKAQKRLRELISATAAVFNTRPEEIALKTRRQNKGKTQYERQNDDGSGLLHPVQEGKARFYVNLRDYLDTGLFLDHRPLRLRIGREAEGKRFLNLFCYTATATVHAALGGARASTSVDMSRTYLYWADRNLSLNGIKTDRHQLVQSDCLKWLDGCKEQFDLILLDPPSFSNSKRMDDVLDVQRDHVDLIDRCMGLLARGGRLYFSNNLRSFKLNYDALSDYRVEDITASTLDPDFARNPKIHHCFTIEHTD